MSQLEFLLSARPSLEQNVGFRRIPARKRTDAKPPDPAVRQSCCEWQLRVGIDKTQIEHSEPGLPYAADHATQNTRRTRKATSERMHICAA